MYEAQKKHGTGTDQELIEVLTAISVVSKRLAMLMDYKGNVTVKIDGIAASAASVIAMAGTKVLMSPVPYHCQEAE